MIKAIISMLCGIASLAYILWQQHYIQRLNEKIQQLEKLISLKNEQLKVYRKTDMGRHIHFLKEYTASPQKKEDHE